MRHDSRPHEKLFCGIKLKVERGVTVLHGYTQAVLSTALKALPAYWRDQPTVSRRAPLSSRILQPDKPPPLTPEALDEAG